MSCVLYLVNSVPATGEVAFLPLRKLNLDSVGLPHHALNTTDSVSVNAFTVLLQFPPLETLSLDMS